MYSGLYSIALFSHDLPVQFLERAIYPPAHYESWCGPVGAGWGQLGPVGRAIA
ncbi:hypothetical protein NG798_00020 [Ancylothrix sp. C2]|uniref:hypothetical protein n=1 Tax=Ancylothrix sp. D3o TaxID=2953691 RepID=UPI0021BB1616|nr:hypothetical protein [Ancylothrix sp. D3o]MCT7948176.1 hypothetical protein [Ancylothrix sp. D3o]